MAHAENSIAIDRPIKTVFDFLLDGMNNPLWRPSGAVFKQGLKGPGGRIDGDYEVVEIKPNELIQFQVIAGPARPTGTYKFESVGNSTRLTFILDYQPKGLAKLMDPMITKSMQGEVALRSNLKSYLESH